MKTLFALIFLLLLTGLAQADQSAVNLIMQGEGFKPYVYLDTTGNYTIGYGFKMNDDLYKRFGNGISEKEAYKYLLEILPRYEGIAKQYHNSSNPAVNAVLTDIAYNIGYKINTFKKMQEALNNGDYIEAGAQLRDSKYCKQVKTRCSRNARILESVK